VQFLCLHGLAFSASGEPPEVVIVSRRTYKGDDAQGYDPTVRLQPGEKVHRFVRGDTYVFYKWARVIEVARLQRIIKEDLNAKDRDDCPPEMLKTIQEGLLKSKFPKKGVQKYCREQWGMDQAKAKPEVEPKPAATES